MYIGFKWSNSNQTKVTIAHLYTIDGGSMFGLVRIASFELKIQHGQQNEHHSDFDKNDVSWVHMIQSEPKRDQNGSPLYHWWLIQFCFGSNRIIWTGNRPLVTESNIILIFSLMVHLWFKYTNLNQDKSRKAVVYINYDIHAFGFIQSGIFETKIHQQQQIKALITK